MKSTNSNCLFRCTSRILVLLLGLGSVVLTASGQFQYQRIKSFGFPQLSPGSSPSAVIEASDGKLYGTAIYGGSNNVGTVFVLNKNGTGLAVLRSFFDYRR